MKKLPFLRLDRHGWLVPSTMVRHVRSPNFNLRPADEEARLLVIHSISLPPNVFGGSYIEKFFTNQLPIREHPFFQQIAHLRVSAHFLIRRTGEIIQFVSTENRAWHAGISHFEGKEGCNDFSLGIELEGSDHVSFTDEQYDSLASLSILLRCHYPLRAVRGHEHIAPQRKTDPGPHFDWNRYRLEGKWSRRELPPSD